MPIQYVKGVGPKRAFLFDKLDVRTVEDLLYFLPSRYLDRSIFRKMRDAKIGEHVTFMGEVILVEGVTRTLRKWKEIFSLILSDGTGSIRCKWFNQPYLSEKFKKGDRIVVSGTVNFYEGKELINPEFEVLSEEEQELIHTGRIVPVYPETRGLSSRVIRSISRRILNCYMKQIEDFLPSEIIYRNNLLPLTLALENIHFPINENKMREAKRRLSFDELFFFQLLIAFRRKIMRHPQSGIAFKNKGLLLKELLRNLHFELTGAQKKVLEEIQRDLLKREPMNRLIQGDVGSGKTIVALGAMLLAIENGYQTALMAPTEILAEQHYIVMKNLLAPLGVSPLLLLGGMAKKETERAYQKVKSGEALAIVGTHALLEEKVTFSSLGLVVIDEQHRFGVMQRIALRKKGRAPHCLVMTATPIPRTLSLTLYGDLDVSIIDEMPPGRKKIITRWTTEHNREKVYEFIRREVVKGRQCYFVYPLVEESEKSELLSAVEMENMLQEKIFPEFKIGLLHGRMNIFEKEGVMNSFRKGEIQILASTTVIEVGVDVPNATLMVVEHAERFGLAQLHQLRGRVGRGEHQSYCILLAGKEVSEEAKERLDCLQETSDGFKIAEKDLQIRGPGEYFGTRQHGLPELKIANLVSDIQLISVVRKEAFSIVEKDPHLLDESHKKLRDRFVEKYRHRVELAEVG